MYQDLKVFQESYNFFIWLNGVIDKFPRTKKSVIGKRLEDLNISLLESLICANKNYEKEYFLKKADIDLEKIRILLRVSKDIKILDFKKYETSEKKIDTIGRLLGGLIQKFKK